MNTPNTTPKTVRDFVSISDINMSYAPVDVKANFHRLGKAALRAIAKDLGLQKGTYSIRSNMGGIAVSGEVTLHSDNLYIQFSQSTVMVYSRPAFMFRSVKSQKDYTGGVNHWMSYLDLLDYPQAIKKFKIIADNQIKLPNGDTLIGSHYINEYIRSKPDFFDGVMNPNV